MYYGELKKCDIANGPGVRVTLFVSGCTNHCKGCFQPQTWDFRYGKPFDRSVKEEIFEELRKDHVRGLTLLGGEPMEPKNQRELVGLTRQVKEEFPGKDIWCFSGFTYDKELKTEGSYPRCEVTDELLSYIDVLVDGRFDLEKKDLRLRYRGSSNQRIIDLKRTEEAGQIVLWDDGLGRANS